MNDTIIAQATPFGRSGVAIVRMSGNLSLEFAKKVSGLETIKPRYAHYCSFKRDNMAHIDSGLLLYFPAPNSYTGEDVVEFQVHGNHIVIEELFEEALKLEGIRYAEAGEFTRRALMNGKMDLLQVEALADLIEADTSTQKMLAQHNLYGSATARFSELRKKMLEARVFCEVFIDFPDDDLPDDLEDQIQEKIVIAQSFLEEMLTNAGHGQRIREGVSVAIVGVPNSGKSTLLNALAGREVAITSNIAGTTRDIIEHHKEINGIPFRFSDTAGIRESDETIEMKGIERARQLLEKSELTVFVYDPTQDHGTQMKLYGEIVSRETIFVFNKSDLVVASDVPKNVSRETIRVSSISSNGVEPLESWLVKNFSCKSVENLYITRDRHLRCLQQSKAELRLALCQPDLVLRAHHLQLAMKFADELVGKVGVEQMLDSLFSDFCIGK